MNYFLAPDDWRVRAVADGANRRHDGASFAPIYVWLAGLLLIKLLESLHFEANIWMIFRSFSNVWWKHPAEGREILDSGLAAFFPFQAENAMISSTSDASVWKGHFLFNATPYQKIMGHIFCAGVFRKRFKKSCKRYPGIWRRIHLFDHY